MFFNGVSVNSDFRCIHELYYRIQRPFCTPLSRSHCFESTLSLSSHNWTNSIAFNPSAKLFGSAMTAANSIEKFINTKELDTSLNAAGTSQRRPIDRRCCSSLPPDDRSRYPAITATRSRYPAGIESVADANDPLLTKATKPSLSPREVSSGIPITYLQIGSAIAIRHRPRPLAMGP